MNIHDAETQAAPTELAWSQDESTEPAEYHGRSYTAALAVGVILGLVGLLALMILGVRYVESTPDVTVTPAPTTTPAPAAIVVPPGDTPGALPSIPDAQVLDVDSRVICLVEANGITNAKGDRTFVTDAHTLCTLAAQGDTIEDMTEGMVGANAGHLDTESAQYFVNLDGVRFTITSADGTFGLRDVT